MVELSEPDKAYMAGIIDGEGSIGIYKHRRPKSKRGYVYEISLSITNTNTKILQFFQQRYGGRITKKWMPKDKPTWKQSYGWNAYSTPSVIILKEVIPYLQGKNESARLVIEFSEILNSIDNSKKRIKNIDGKDIREGKTYTCRMHEIYEMIKLINGNNGKVREYRRKV